MGRGGEYRLRWFTPRLEIDLCGHATLGTAYVIFNRLEPGLTRASFETRSGTLTVEGEGDMLWLDFPSRPPQSVQPPANLSAGLGAQPQETLAVATICSFSAARRK
jgi:PhzF family phenazine biosynthesis protein